MNPILIFDFNTKSDLSNWRVVNDGVMGGTSRSKFYLNSKGHGCFDGTVSLENNGGFCSVKYEFNSISLDKKKLFAYVLKEMAKTINLG